MSENLVPFVPVPVRVAHDPIDLAVRDVELAAADFMIAVFGCQTVNDALNLHRRIVSVIDVLNAVSSASMEKADRLSREKD